MAWKEYEQKVSEYFTNKFPGAKLERNIKLFGNKSRTEREIDILLENTLFGCSMQLVIECKSWNKKLDVADIGTFIDKLNDIGIPKGIMISKAGYTEAAYTRAKSEVNVQLQVLNFDNLDAYIGFWGNAYRGNLGAIISAPNGWVINNNVPPSKLIDFLCFMHPMSFSLEESQIKKQFMYFQIFPNIGTSKLEDAFRHQVEEVLEKDSKAKIKYWKENSPKGELLYRQIDYEQHNYTEITGGAQCDDFFAYCVYALPNDYNSDDMARLKHVMNELHLLKIKDVDPVNSHEAWTKLQRKIGMGN